ncbi:uncharacterized protein BJ212DRAFT_1447828 [Suillus subaureus]|uniref:Uncharacterized protein n=1 Tax=Suillus subaureus TaxID=48587 RepID=A0A9P7JC42_9AGAM|nr:uncharacterized protein BJ212DRAFT_1447828 [Suillus subaureus]KAG1813633.1 hypothetical protein BJ212DRAFT_1447828 [Suillus subaureus]
MKSPGDWTPYCNQLEFEAAEFLYTKNQMSAHQINKILYYWGITLASYDVWFWDPHAIVQNMLANSDYVGQIDYTSYHEFQEKDEKCHYKDFMSGDWSWLQSDKITQDLQTHGTAFVPIILGSDKTMVSVSTGQNDYYPLYISIGNFHNNVWCVHHNALVLVGFMAIPKSVNDPAFCKFKKQMFHSSLSKILTNLKSGMTTLEVTWCGDCHYCCFITIYGLGPYIVDYEEQVVLAGIVKNWCRSFGIIGKLVPFTNDFSHANIHQLLAPDLLHQLIKGTFKDHLVEWVGKYLKHEYGKAGAAEIMDDIDRRISVVPLFPSLWCFPQGCGFSQWTGDNSKALMKILIQLFGAPNGLCSSITKSKYIKAVKKSWQHSSKHKALSQMLLTNQCLDKIAAAVTVNKSLTDLFASTTNVHKGSCQAG